MHVSSNVIFFPGSFDPITVGHQEVVSRLLNLFPNTKIIIAIAVDSSKQPCFSVTERRQLMEKIYIKQPLVSAISFSGLLVKIMQKYKAKIIVRGVRNTDDFAYETKLATMNQYLYPSVETLFLASDPVQSVISSSLVKEIGLLGGDVSAFVSPIVNDAIKNKHIQLNLTNK